MVSSYYITVQFFFIALRPKAGDAYISPSEFISRVTEALAGRPSSL